MRYLQGTKDHMLTYRKFYHFDVIGYLDSNYAGCVDKRKSIFGYLFLLAKGATSLIDEFMASFEVIVQTKWL